MKKKLCPFLMAAAITSSDGGAIANTDCTDECAWFSDDELNLCPCGLIKIGKEIASELESISDDLLRI